MEMEIEELYKYYKIVQKFNVNKRHVNLSLSYKGININVQISPMFFILKYFLVFLHLDIVPYSIKKYDA